MATFEELSEAQREALAKAAHKLFHNPEVSDSAKKLLTKADPTVRFPELEAQERVQAELKERDKIIQELQEKQIRAEAEQSRREKRQQAIDAGLDPDEVEKAIVERGIAKWETAMEYVRMSMQTAAPTPSAIHNHRIDLPPNDGKLWENPNEFARSTAHKMIDELRQRGRVG